MSEEQTQHLIQQMQALETYFSDLTQREKMFLNVLQEAAETSKSLRSLSEKPESNTLLPIGMGVYIPAKVSSDVQTVMSIGAGITMEKNVDSTVNYLEARIKEMEVALQDTVNAKQNVASQLEQGKTQINQLMQAPKPGSG